MLEEASGCVHEHQVCDAVYQVQDSLLDFGGWLCPVYGILEHHTESLDVWVKGVWGGGAKGGGGGGGGAKGGGGGGQRGRRGGV